MKSLIRCFLTCFLILNLSGCQKKQELISVPAFPLEESAVQGALAQAKLSWTIEQLEMPREDTNSYSLYDEDGKFVAIIDSTGELEKRRLQLSFMSSERNSGKLARSLTEEEWEKAFRLAALLYGGFEGEDQLLSAFHEAFKEENFISDQIYDEVKYTGWKWEESNITAQIRLVQWSGLQQIDLYTICLYNDEEYRPDF